VNLTPELVKIREGIESYARGYRLDFFTVIFELIDFEQMNAIASYGGFPNRYPHWSFGMEYDQLSKGYTYGLHKIYEMVINNDPSYAYLLESSPLLDQKLVMAHVYAHSDFFKNNLWFGKTNRKMMDEMANHSIRIRRYIDKHGFEIVENFLDICLSIDNLIDSHAPFMEKKEKPREPADESTTTPKLRSKDYMDSYINPPEFIESQTKKMKDEQDKKKKIPANPEKDILLFLIESAPLEKWQQDILAIIRDEAYYFVPQAQTKIMNEGWASYWHSKIMTTRALQDSELIDYADHHSGTLASSPGRINPYKIGIELFRDIEDRWNKGRFGKDWEDVKDWKEKQNWDKKAGLGLEKIFQVRKLYNDVMFIDEFLTEDFCAENKLFTYRYNDQTSAYEIDSRNFQDIKKQFLFNLTNFGQPFIYVVDGNYANRGELYLQHRFEGVELKMDYAQDVLKNLYQIWTRPISLETIVREEKKLLTFDGEKHSEQNIT
jgi:stage V sporulation protein R